MMSITIGQIIQQFIETIIRDIEVIQLLVI